MPVAWDESCLLAGYPSDHAVIARRKGDSWYFGGINGKAEARELEFTLPEACKGKKIQWITDGEDIHSFAESVSVYDGGTIRLPVLEGGGFVGRMVAD